MPKLITCYVNPDLDGTSGALAYAEYLAAQGQDVAAGIIGQPHDEAQFVIDHFKLAPPLLLDDASAYQDVVLVDASDLNGLNGKIMPAQVVEIIDHRKIHETDKFPRAKAQIELVGAAATLIAEKFMAANLPISRRNAILLQTAIISNTLNFKGSVCTPRDVEAAAWLQQTSLLPQEFWRELFMAKSDLSGDKLAARMESDFAHFSFGGKTLGIAQLEIMGVAELIANRRTEILSLLRAKQKAMTLDYMFQNTIDIAVSENHLVATDAATEALLGKALAVSFTGSVAMRAPALMRKQIVPLIKAILEP